DHLAHLGVERRVCPEVLRIERLRSAHPAGVTVGEDVDAAPVMHRAVQVLVDRPAHLRAVIIALEDEDERSGLSNRGEGPPVGVPSLEDTDIGLVDERPVVSDIPEAEAVWITIHGLVRLLGLVTPVRPRGTAENAPVLRIRLDRVLPER